MYVKPPALSTTGRHVEVEHAAKLNTLTRVYLVQQYLIPGYLVPGVSLGLQHLCVTTDSFVRELMREQQYQYITPNHGKAAILPTMFCFVRDRDSCFFAFSCPQPMEISTEEGPGPPGSAAQHTDSSR